MILVSARTTRRAIAALALVTTQLAGQAKPFVPQIERTQLADGVFHFKAGPDGYVASTNMVVALAPRSHAPRFRERLAQREEVYAREMATGKDDDGNVLTGRQKADETAYIARLRGFVAETQGCVVRTRHSRTSTSSGSVAGTERSCS